MKKRYMIKLKGTNCYLKSVGENKINFTTDASKAKVFERDPEKMDIIDKLNAREYKTKKESHKSDHIRLTMDKETWQKMYYEHLDQIQEISDCRLNIHQFDFSLVKKLKAKAKSYSDEFPNFECDYYGEDFERYVFI